MKTCRRQTSMAVVVMLISVVWAAEASAEQYMYWLENQSMYRGATDRSDLTLVLTGLVDTGDLAVDLDRGKLYWSDFRSHKIFRADIDGTDVQTFYTSSIPIYTQAFPLGMALDTTHGKLYWTERTNVMRCNVDGSAVETLFTGGSGGTGIALDVAGNRMYWTDCNQDLMRSANLDGSDVRVVINAASYGSYSAMQDVALDLVNHRAYVIDAYSSMRRCNLDSSGLVNLGVGSYYGSSVAVDPLAGLLYWTDQQAGGIHVADLDAHAAGMYWPRPNYADGLNLVPEPATLSLLGLGLAGLIARRKRAKV